MNGRKERFAVGLPRGESAIFLSWRLLSDDPPDAGFHVERRLADGGTWQRV